MEGLKGIRRRQQGCGKRGQSVRYRHAFKVQAVKLYLEGRATAGVICRETGVSHSGFSNWVKAYRERGEAGLGPRERGGRGKQLAPAVREKIVELKKSDPRSGVKRISQILRRVFLLPGSAETVRKTLHEEHLIDKPKRKPRKNPSRPRFFERSTPNQLWQADIFTFRLGGRNAYLIGYIDDFSRYITGLELFRSQTTENVLEVYRRGAGEYNPPKEMLTDNGRQYTNWRGTSRFEAEMKKDRVKHIKSRPHHPMTLGKIERFWKTIFGEYLARTQFTSFEDARERVGLWVKYYNHKRPHQGIGGLCPADRYFEVHTELKKTLQEGIKESILEMALRGRPRSPFYMVGRMENQSVVLRAEKGKLRVTVDDAGSQEPREVVYDLNQSTQEERYGGEGGEQSNGESTEASVHCRAEVPGSALGVVGTPQALGGVPGLGGQVDGSEAVAGSCVGGDAAGVGASGAAGSRARVEPTSSDAPGQARQEAHGGAGTAEPVGAAACEDPAGAAEPEEFASGEEEVEEGRDGYDEGSGACEEAGDSDHAGSQRQAHGAAGSNGSGGLTEDLLRVGAAGSGCNGTGDGKQGQWTPSTDCGSGEGGPEGACEGVGAEARGGPGNGGGAQYPSSHR